MHPELFKIGTFELRSYGVLLVIGVIVAATIARKRAAAYHIEPDKIWDAALWMVLPGILGARITYILQFWSYYQAHPSELYSLRFEGLTSFGGLIFGFIGAVIWQRRSKTKLVPFLDTLGVPVLVAQAIGRIGCLLNGCCYGRPTSEWFGVTVVGLPDKHVPAQVIDTFLMLLGALVITIIERIRSLKSGTSFSLFLVAYGVSRFIYEIFRGGTREEFKLGIASSAYLGQSHITLAQVTSAAFLLLGLLYYLGVRKFEISTQSVAEVANT